MPCPGARCAVGWSPASAGLLLSGGASCARLALHEPRASSAREMRARRPRTSDVGPRSAEGRGRHSLPARSFDRATFNSGRRGPQQMSSRLSQQMRRSRKPLSVRRIEGSNPSPSVSSSPKPRARAVLLGLKPRLPRNSNSRLKSAVDRLKALARTWPAPLSDQVATRSSQSSGRVPPRSRLPSLDDEHVSVGLHFVLARRQGAGSRTRRRPRGSRERKGE